MMVLISRDNSCKIKSIRLPFSMPGASETCNHVFDMAFKADNFFMHIDFIKHCIECIFMQFSKLTFTVFKFSNCFMYFLFLCRYHDFKSFFYVGNLFTNDINSFL